MTGQLSDISRGSRRRQGLRMPRAARRRAAREAAEAEAQQARQAQQETVSSRLPLRSPTPSVGGRLGRTGDNRSRVGPPAGLQARGWNPAGSTLSRCGDREPYGAGGRPGSMLPLSRRLRSASGRRSFAQRLVMGDSPQSPGPGSGLGCRACVGSDGATARASRAGAASPHRSWTTWETCPARRTW